MFYPGWYIWGSTFYWWQSRFVRGQGRKPHWNGSPRLLWLLQQSLPTADQGLLLESSGHSLCFNFKVFRASMLTTMLDFIQQCIGMRVNLSDSTVLDRVSCRSVVTTICWWKTTLTPSSTKVETLVVSNSPRFDWKFHLYTRPMIFIFFHAVEQLSFFDHRIDHCFEVPYILWVFHTFFTCFCNCTELDFRFLVGAPFHGLKAFATTNQLGVSGINLRKLNMIRACWSLFFDGNEGWPLVVIWSVLYA